MQNTINQILTGWRLLNYDGNYFYARGPTGRESLLKEFHLNIVKEQLKADGFLPKKQLKQLLLDTGNWSPFKDFKVKKINRALDAKKKEFFQFRLKKKRQRLVDKEIKKLSNDLRVLLIEEASLLSNCLEDIADSQAFYCIIHLLCKNISWEPLWHSYEAFTNTDRNLVNGIINTYLCEFSIKEPELRKIARSGIWRVYYKGGDPIRLFDKPPSDIDVNQINILYWSSLYDSAFNSYEPPPDLVIENDILFDAWIDDQGRKAKAAAMKSQVDKKAVKNRKGITPNLTEVFVMTDEEGSKEFYENVI